MQCYNPILLIFAGWCSVDAACKSALLLAVKSLKSHSPSVVQMYKLLLPKLHFPPDVQERLLCFHPKYDLGVAFL